ncbi:MAG: DUF222 domain-containing protein [Ilumatobacter sp.]|uniref:HNH endonuclease signature motif containing protein n=1 Tax=Ilumatobacter sp. TaxID=1967498 RepID=UPI003C793FEC
MFAGAVEALIDVRDAEVRDRLRVNEMRRRELDAEMALLVSVADERGLYSKLDGHRSMAAFLRAEINCSTSEAATWRSLGRTVNRLEGVGEAWMTGRFGRGQAKKIAEARSNRRVNDQLGPFVPIFIDQAEILEHADFTKLVDSTVQRLDADGAHDARDEAIEHRNAHVSAVGDGVVISASGGDPVTAVELEGILDRFSDREYAIDVAANTTLWGDDAHLHELQRTPGQRRHDAIVAIFRAAVASGESGEAAALVLNIVCDAVTWAEISHEAGLATETNLAGQRVDPFTGLERPKDLLDELTADPASILDRRCETDTGVPVHPHDVLRAALSGHVRRVVVDTAGTVIDMGRRRRLYTGSARDAAKLLVTRCQHPGCRMPARFAQVDHADEWVADDGRTDQSNAGIECGPHNVEKHRRRWRTRKATNGKTYTIREDGTIMLPVGARLPALAEPEPAVGPDPGHSRPSESDASLSLDAVDAIWQDMTRSIRLVDSVELALASGR